MLDQTVNLRLAKPLLCVEQKVLFRKRAVKELRVVGVDADRDSSFEVEVLSNSV